MSDSPADFHRDPAVMVRLKEIAAGLFAKHGIDFSSARRAGGWTNATWLAGGLALRMSVQPGKDAIRREAGLSALLPPEVGYPPVLETGETDGYEWCLSRKMPGKSLWDAWPGLEWAERVTATRRLWEKARAVHSVDLTSAGNLAGRQPWFNATDLDKAATALARLIQQGILTSHQGIALSEALNHYWELLPSAGCVLCHGDLTYENSLCHAGQVVTLLDFEHAVIAPAELDLNELVKCTFIAPEIYNSLSTEDKLGHQLMQQAVRDIALPVLDHPGGRKLLFGYAVLLELWMLEDWLAHPEGEGPIETWQPYQMLQSLADGNGGYLAPFIEQG